MSSQNNNNNPNKNAIYCRWGCGKRITFDERIVSKNGIKIPLDHDTRLPHECPIRNQGNLKLKTQSTDQNFKNTTHDSKDVWDKSSPLFDRQTILKRISEDIEYYNSQQEQILIQQNQLKNQQKEIMQLLKELTTGLS